MTGLIRCDARGCDVLVERHVLRCRECIKRLGEHPEATGKNGWILDPRWGDNGGPKPADQSNTKGTP